MLVNSIYAFGQRSLARLLGDSPEAAEFDREADRTLDALVTKCWDEEAGAFFTRPVGRGGKAVKEGDHQFAHAAGPERPATAYGGDDGR